MADRPIRELPRQPRHLHMIDNLRGEPDGGIKTIQYRSQARRHG